MSDAIYDDRTVRCDEQEITIRSYYPWGDKRIRYSSVRGVEVLPLTGANRMRKWRIWGSGDFIHWWNLDPNRLRKDVALVLDVGRRVYPTITPDDAATVARIITGKMRG
ncbi:hypothetical protein [Frankia sp. R82]|uniref:hypothetical protein n=1 Tax=Frankia sp. R82 TaxID=2950553 RepID=UPI0020438FEF|nr:hypothetical protein [Frankia sp. R82]MCM3883347.1 hypothetical protein [Frankia sp. R82]